MTTTTLALELDRPLAFLDLETTGTNTETDRIVEVAILLVHPGGGVVEKVRRVNPGVPIPEEATEVHGITDADVADSPTFRQVAGSLLDLLAGCDFRRVQHQPLRSADVGGGVPPRRGAQFPRDLSAAVRFYAGRDHQGDAHGALADVHACVDVLNGQLERYGDLPRDSAGLHDYCVEVRPYLTELDRWFDQSKDPPVVLRGKHKGEAIGGGNIGYLNWMARQPDMDPDVLAFVRARLQRSYG